MAKKEKKEKKKFFKSVIAEIKKVRWPKKKEMIKYSLATLICIVVFALFFMLSDVVIAAVKSVLEAM